VSFERGAATEIEHALFSMRNARGREREMGYLKFIKVLLIGSCTSR
jgi:hypothetical protein